MNFLREHEAETIYLVGDIIDGWKLSRRFYWPQNHNDIVQKLLRKVRKGTKMFWVAGNHDEFLRHFIGNNIGGIELVDEVVHVTADQKRLLVLHGDRFDGITKYHKWLALIGDVSYSFLLRINHWHSRIRNWLGFRQWSLSAYLKHKVKKAANFISDYENTIAEECKHRDFDGIVCGHIHHAEIKNIGYVMYFNSGDWVESCTALVEDFDGNISILRNL